MRIKGDWEKHIEKEWKKQCGEQDRNKQQNKTTTTVNAKNSN